MMDNVLNQLNMYCGSVLGEVPSKNSRNSSSAKKKLKKISSVETKTESTGSCPVDLSCSKNKSKNFFDNQKEICNNMKSEGSKTRRKYNRLLHVTPSNEGVLESKTSCKTSGFASRVDRLQGVPGRGEFEDLESNRDKAIQKTIVKQENIITQLQSSVQSVCSNFTEDGFKIMSSIPSDDSDISDAFESDIDEDLWIANSNEIKLASSQSNDMRQMSSSKVTEDGFKIVPSIPSDDSDISDAFESDIDEELWETDAKNHAMDISRNLRDETSGGEEVLSKNEFREDILFNIKKPLLKLINDFGIENRIRSKTMPKMLPNVKEPEKQVTVIDYSKKRGKRKTSDQPKNPIANDRTKTKANQQEIFKKARYDVYKYGISGFEKETKENLKVNLAIKLGAKPLKNPAKNYKIIIEEGKLAKKLEREKRENGEDEGIQIRQPVQKKSGKEKQSKGNISLHFQTGKFKKGVLTLSKKDVERIKST